MASKYLLQHVADRVLLDQLKKLVAQERGTLANLLAHLAEVDSRRLYAPEGYAAMHLYCEGALGLGENAAARRLTAARLARRHPEVLAAVADGRLTLTTVCLLAPYADHPGFADWIELSAHRTKRQVQELLAERFPRPDVPTMLRPVMLAPMAHAAPVVSAPLATSSPEMLATSTQAATPATPENADADAKSGQSHALARIGSGTPSEVASVPVPVPTWTRLAPLSPGRHEFRTTLDEETVELLRKAQDLLSHVIPSRAAPDVLKRVLADWVRASERRKYGLTDQPKAARSGAPDGGRIPAAMQRAVMRRDGHRCTFVSADGRRCESRTRLEFDHVRPLARGGQTTVDNLRMRCRAHNFHEAERVFGKGFMARKLAQAKHRGS